MKRKTLVLFALIGLLLGACAPESTPEVIEKEVTRVVVVTAAPTPLPTSTPIPPPVKGEPSDYFPTGVGAKWVYEIEVGEVDPLYYRETVWPVGEEDAWVYSTRGRFFLADGLQKTFMLEMKVKGVAAKQGLLEYPIGVELEIEKDELGIFEGAKKVFWAVIPSQFMAHEVVTYPSDMLGAPTSTWGAWGQEDGFSVRLVFFAEKPGVAISMGEEPKDKLLFVGVETHLPRYEGESLLYFLRTVEPAESEEGEAPSYLDNEFTEDTWFAKGKGLVRLEQRVNGETSMVWTLIQMHK